MLSLAVAAAGALAAVLWLVRAGGPDEGSGPRPVPVPGPEGGGQGVVRAPIPPAPGDLLVDVSDVLGLDFVHQLVDGDMSNLVESLGTGAAFFDYDGDGWLDLYLVQSGWDADLVEGERPRRPPLDRLYRNVAGKRFEEVGARLGLEATDFGFAAVAADYDGDGWVDLYVCNAGPNRLYRNLRGERFEEVAAVAGVADPRLSVGATFFDFDGDADLDLYVTNYLDFDPDYDYFYNPDAFPPPLAYQPQPDALYENLGDGTFADVSAASGIERHEGRGMSVVAFDFDGDRRTDIFVSNDATANFLWRNTGSGSFEESAVAFGVAFGENGEATGAMSADVGDYDRDGGIDLFVSDIAYSSLYRNERQGFFTDTVVPSQVARLTGRYTSWGGGFLDFDLDGLLDLLVVNGDLHHVVGWEDQLLRNAGGGVFADAAELSAYFAVKLPGRGGAVADYDNDGDPDILITNFMERTVLLRNDAGGGRSWLGLALRDSDRTRTAYGARVVLHCGERELTAELRCPTSYLCSGDPRLLFGLGEAPVVDRIDVIWPEGETQVLREVAVNRYLEIERKSG